MRITKGILRENRRNEEVRSLLNSKRVSVGMDLGKKSHVAVVSDMAGNIRGNSRVEHSTAGVESLIERIKQSFTGVQHHEIIVFMEPTSHFWMNVANVLEHKGVAYRLIHPLTLASKRRIHKQSNDHDDLKDARLILKLGLEGEFTETRLEHHPERAIMEFLASEYQDVQDITINEQNRIRAYLETTFPEYMKVFPSLFGKTSLAALQNLTALLNDDTPDVLQTRIRTDYRGKRFYQKKVKTLCEQFRNGSTFGIVSLREGAFYRVEKSARRLASFLVELERTNDLLLEAYTRSEYARYADSFPVVGRTLKAQTLAFIGDPSAYDDSACLVSLAGLDPAENWSSSFKGQTRITRRGRARLRRTAVQAAYALIKGSALWRGYFLNLTTRKENQLKYYQALCACAAKYLRNFWFLCNNRQHYDERLFVGSMRAGCAVPKSIPDLDRKLSEEREPRVILGLANM